MKKIVSIFVLSVFLTGNVWGEKPNLNNQKNNPAVANTNTSNSEIIAPITLPEIAATAYVIKDLQSEQIIAEKGLTKKIEPASLSKLMAAYLVFQALEKGKITPEQTVTTSQKAWKTEGSRMFLEINKPVSISDLIKGMIVQSGNDAAITLAEAIAGSEEAFVAQMNETAQKLGMTHTHFDNVTGLSSPNHLSTVADLMILSEAIIRDYSQYYPVFSLKSFSYNGITQNNRNLLLYRDSDVDGLMAGYSSNAGYNLIATSKRNGRRVLSIVVGTASPEARATESSKLLNYALHGYSTPKIYTAGQELAKIKVYKGTQEQVSIGFNQDVFATIKHGQENHLNPILETQQPVLAPISKGQVLGTLKLMDGEKLIVQKSVVALEDVAQSGWFARAWDSIKLWFYMMFAD